MENRVAIVTGGLSGIGKAIAERLLQDGMLVCIGARRADDPALSRDLKEKWGDRLWVASLDVAESTSVDAFVARAHEHSGRIDILINAAGI